MKITCARLRSNVKYEGPLATVLDSFLENYVKWMRNNPQNEYRTYNISFDGTRPKRTPESIEWADVIVIPSDSEFRYHGELQMNPKDLEKSPLSLLITTTCLPLKCGMMAVSYTHLTLPTIYSV